VVLQFFFDDLFYLVLEYFEESFYGLALYLGTFGHFSLDTLQPSVVLFQIFFKVFE